MKTFVSIITLGLAVAFAAPAFAADKAPTSKSACEKAHMTWDATAKKCKWAVFFGLKAAGFGPPLAFLIEARSHRIGLAKGADKKIRGWATLETLQGRNSPRRLPSPKPQGTIRGKMDLHGGLLNKQRRCPPWIAHWPPLWSEQATQRVARRRFDDARLSIDLDAAKNNTAGLEQIDQQCVVG
jgi:hypothetical protein